MIEKICGKNLDTGILFVRIALGIIFIGHGWQKLQGMEGVISFFGTLGLSPFFAYLVMAVELGGGILILLGILTQYVGLLFAINMAFAIILVKSSKGLLGGYEFELVLLLCGLAVMFAGAGRYTIGRLFKARENMALNKGI